MSNYMENGSLIFNSEPEALLLVNAKRNAPSKVAQGVVGSDPRTRIQRHPWYNVQYNLQQRTVAFSSPKIAILVSV